MSRLRKLSSRSADPQTSNEIARLDDGDPPYGAMHHWLDLFICECEARVKFKALSPRTLADYRRDIEPLKIFFGKMLPNDIKPRHVQDYLQIGAAADRSVRANREKACLSSCISWMIRTGQVPELIVNPCLRASGIRRNPEKKRDRYVTDDEYREVYKLAPPQVKAMLDLCYRTLQRPASDIIFWTMANITHNAIGDRVLRVLQNKTKKTVDIRLTPELADLLAKLTGTTPVAGRPLICTRKGEGYTYDGLSAMLRRAIAKANKAREAAKREAILPFGFRDLKGKGATDMWLSGESIERIQLLCGHEDSKTTEIYVKQRWREAVQPNRLKIEQ